MTEGVAKLRDAIADQPILSDRPTLRILSTGEEFPIVSTLDVDGDETDNPEDVHTVIAELPGGEFLRQDVTPEEFFQRKSN